jgi:hypothetical protein
MRTGLVRGCELQFRNMLENLPEEIVLLKAPSLLADREEN